MVLASKIESYTTAFSFGDGAISWPRKRIAATMEAATSRAPSVLAAGRFLAHAGFCLGVPLAISSPEYRYVFQQQEQVTSAALPGGVSSGFMCSAWGSVAKQTITHPQPLHVTIQGEDIRQG